MYCHVMNTTVDCNTSAYGRYTKFSALYKPRLFKCRTCDSSMTFPCSRPIFQPHSVTSKLQLLAWYGNRSLVIFANFLKKYKDKRVNELLSVNRDFRENKSTKT